MDRFIVMTAAACMPASCWGRYGKVAVVERSGDLTPTAIDARHKSVARVVAVWDRCNIGKTDRCAFSQARAAAAELAADLNKVSAYV
jgi:hypothetical protein